MAHGWNLGHQIVQIAPTRYMPKRTAFTGIASTRGRNAFSRDFDYLWLQSDLRVSNNAIRPISRYQMTVTNSTLSFL